MSERKPIPIQVIPTRLLCPVCGKTSYSLTGTHPQCLVARADTLSRAALKAAGSDIKKLPSKKSWSKPCPKCKRQIPARRIVCDCGHQFAGMFKNEPKKLTNELSQTSGQAYRRPETSSLE